MDFFNIGTTGIRVSKLCLGLAFRGYNNRVQEEIDCIKTIERAIDHGINFIDCANIYGHGLSEKLLGTTLKRLGNRDQFVVTTKVGKAMGNTSNQRGLSRENILREIDNSLRRLQLDYLDIYLMHQPDQNVTLEESLQTMDEIVRQGKARAVGISNHPTAEVVEMLWTAERNHLTSPSILQYKYNLLHRWRTETDVIPLCHRHGLGLMTYSPLAIGLLSGKVLGATQIPADNYWYNQSNLDQVLARAKPIIDALVTVARELGKTPVQVAIAWLLANPAVSAPIIGPDTPDHVDELVGSVGWEIPVDSKNILDRISAGGGPFELTESNRTQLQHMKPSQ